MTAVSTETAVATWVVGQGGNDTWWRVEAPAEAIGGKAILVPMAQADEALGGPNTHTPFPWSMKVKRARGPERTIHTTREFIRFARTQPDVRWFRPVLHAVEGTLVFARPSVHSATLAEYARQDGTLTVAETDDNYFPGAGENIFLRMGKADETMRSQHAKSMVRFDRNVFSTTWLRDRYHREYRRRFGKRALPQLHVCRNHVPHDWWPEREERDGPTRVGFMGSSSHIWDVNLAYASFHAAKQFGCETWVIGYNPAKPQEEETTRLFVDGVELEAQTDASKRVAAQWETVIDKHVKWIKPSEYHRASFPLDIGLCPLWHNDFTAGKSDSKALEYTISGAAVVAMQTPAFTRAGWVNEVNCLLAGSQVEMAEQTVRLIRDPVLRKDLLQAAQEMVWNERCEDQMRTEWMEAVT